jgi:hypothetical protein
LRSVDVPAGVAVDEVSRLIFDPRASLIGED